MKQSNKSCRDCPNAAAAAVAAVARSVVASTAMSAGPEADAFTATLAAREAPALQRCKDLLQELQRSQEHVQRKIAAEAAVPQVPPEVTSAV